MTLGTITKTVRAFLRDARQGRWWMFYGKWWMLQFCLDGWFSLGFHVDPRFRRTGKTGERYGPYVDLHLGCFIVSLGVNPVLSGDLEATLGLGRGGIAEMYR